MAVGDSPYADLVLEFQVNNPVSVLNQDQSKTFIANSTDVNKYLLFYRATQLEAMEENYRVGQPWHGRC